MSEKEEKLEFIENELKMTNKSHGFINTRIFDMKNKCFLPKEKELFISVRGDKIITSSGELLEMADLVIQPEIGSQDKNGNMIYLGDLLKTDEGGWRAVVVYGQGRFLCEDEMGGFSSFVDWSECEIIGNIGDMYASGDVEPWL